MSALHAADVAVTSISLPALRVNGQPARAHTQGLEIQGGEYYVTARREDVLPKRALLLRSDPRRTDWDVWDITPIDAQGNPTRMDHPGGMQSDGKRLWIPVAESRRNSRSLIRIFPIANLVAKEAAKPEFEFPVNDHIGAVAVCAARKLVFGANWDTEKVYVWDLEGRLQRTLSDTELERLELGVVSGLHSRAGLAVQDWKVLGDRLFASGLFRGRGVVPEAPQSRLISFVDFPGQGTQWRSGPLPKQDGTELAREAMAIEGDVVCFLPGDLGVSNRIYRVSLADLAR